MRARVKKQSGGADRHPLRGAENHGGLPAFQPGPAQRGRSPQGLPHQVWYDASVAQSDCHHVNLLWKSHVASQTDVRNAH